MPYIDADTPTGRRWVSDRDTVWSSDPLRRASETLARDLETFLYDEVDAKYHDTHFLMWAVARYDIAKTGSGRYADTVDYDPTEALKISNPEPRDRVSPAAYAEIDVRFPEHARQVINADELPAPGEPDTPRDEPEYSRPDLPSGYTDGRQRAHDDGYQIAFDDLDAFEPKDGDE